MLKTLTFKGHYVFPRTLLYDHDPRVRTDLRSSHFLQRERSYRKKQLFLRKELMIGTTLPNMHKIVVSQTTIRKPELSINSKQNVRGTLPATRWLMYVCPFSTNNKTRSRCVGEVLRWFLSLFCISTEYEQPHIEMAHHLDSTRQI